MSLMAELNAKAQALGVPISAHLDVTYRCNERCEHCYLEHDDKGEMTTAEMLSRLRSMPVGADLAPALRDLAGAADQIKFARGQGLAEEAERHLSATRAMVETVEARLKPATPATPESGQAA